MNHIEPRRPIVHRVQQALCLVAFGLLLLPSFARAQATSAPTDLLASPQAGAKVLKALPPKTNLKISTRQGFWLEVEAAGSKGWVKATAVQFGSGAKTLGGIDTGRTGKGNIVSTSAARGLSPKELVAAKPDFGQVDRLQRLAVSSQEGEAFAGMARLPTRKLALLQAPPEGKTPAATSGGASSKTRKAKKASDEDDEDDE